MRPRFVRFDSAPREVLAQPLFAAGSPSWYAGGSRSNLPGYAEPYVGASDVVVAWYAVASYWAVMSRVGVTAADVGRTGKLLVAGKNTEAEGRPRNIMIAGAAVRLAAHTCFFARHVQLAMRLTQENSTAACGTPSGGKVWASLPPSCL
jgi:hypothetical protein